MFLIYLAAMGVSILLERQKKRQESQIALEFARLGYPVPPVQPRIQTLEALLNIAIGIVMVVPAVQGFGMIFSNPWLMAQTGPGMGEFFGVLLAAGLTLIFLGSKALRQNLIRRREASRQVRADR
jgi:hypothetical protein